jgi:thiosulfate/3-mercaptopyruvate sulfurtransferase
MMINAMLLRRCLLWGMTVLSSVVGLVQAAVLPGPLVTPEWLATNQSAVTILEIREDPGEYVASHIPGSRLVVAGKIRQTRNIEGRDIPAMLPDASAIEVLMRSIGVNAKRPLVIVAAGRTVEEFDGAARLYWTLKYYGADELAILDGGHARWVAEGRATERGMSEQTVGDWSAGVTRMHLLADTKAVMQASASGVQLVDARPFAFFHGLAKRPVVAAYGHIPGSRVFPTELRAKPEGSVQRYLTVEDYRSILQSLQIAEDRPTITYCNTGHMGAGAWFILSELVGNPQVSLYDGSMAEWADGSRPVARY